MFVGLAKKPEFTIMSNKNSFCGFKLLHKLSTDCCLGCFTHLNTEKLLK